jgi:hypothetical protein
MLWTPDAFIYASPTNQSTGQVPSAPVEKQTAEELQQLVTPIALYPDALVSQILAGATYPTEIVETDRWLQEHPNLKGKDLAKAVDQQSLDPSIKALTQFPSVLANMDKNLSWTLDICAGRGLRKPARGRPGRRASHASSRKIGREFEKQ